MPQPMPKISLSVPAYTNDNYSGLFPASNANDSTYGGQDYWRCQTTPAGNANSGTLTQAVYLAYDLSGVPSSQRQNVVLIWYNDPTTGPYDVNLIANNGFNIPSAYTIDANTAAGGSLPSSGWTTLVTVANGEPYHSRQHALNLSGYNWVRINVTAIVGSVANNNASLNMDVHDAHLGNQDNWIFYGDSITQRAFTHNDTTIPAQINSAKPSYFPLWECAGEGGWTATDGQGYVGSTFLPLFTGQYVALLFGTNDANGGGALVTNYSSKMQSMITSIVSAGKIPVLAHIPYGTTANIIANGPTINSAIDALLAANPTVIAGPDLWAYFLANQSYISGDGIHMTDPAGYNAYIAQWVNWATANIYLSILNTETQSKFKVRTALGSLARSVFKIRQKMQTVARSKFLISVSNEPQSYNVTATTTTSPPRPYSTIVSQATVTNASGALQNLPGATVVVTFQDGTTLSPTVYWLGNGVYEVIYTSKPGVVIELWTFTDTLGSVAEYQHRFVCAF